MAGISSAAVAHTLCVNRYLVFHVKLARPHFAQVKSMCSLFIGTHSTSMVVLTLLLIRACSCSPWLKTVHYKQQFSLSRWYEIKHLRFAELHQSIFWRWHRYRWWSECVSTHCHLNWWQTNLYFLVAFSAMKRRVIASLVLPTCPIRANVFGIALTKSVSAKIYCGDFDVMALLIMAAK